MMYVHMMPFQMPKRNSLACLGPDPSKASPDDFIKYYKTCLGTLKEKTRETAGSEDQRVVICLLYNAVRTERICTRLCTQVSDVQHQLEKYIPNVHKTSDGSEIELIHAFVLKAGPDISEELIS